MGWMVLRIPSTVFDNGKTKVAVHTQPSESELVQSDCLEPIHIQEEVTHCLDGNYIRVKQAAR